MQQMVYYERKRKQAIIIRADEGSVDGRRLRSKAGYACTSYDLTHKSQQSSNVLICHRFMQELISVEHFDCNFEIYIFPKLGMV